AGHGPEGRADPRVGGEAIAPALLDRLDELGGEESAFPDLSFIEPFAAELVQPRPPVLDEEVEDVLALEVGGEAEPEAQVVRAPAFLLRLDDQDAAIGLGSDLVVDALEVAAAVDAPQVRADA